MSDDHIEQAVSENYNVHLIFKYFQCVSPLNGFRIKLNFGFGYTEDLEFTSRHIACIKSVCSCCHNLSNTSTVQPLILTATSFKFSFQTLI